jgi:hypothetical protein
MVSAYFGSILGKTGIFFSIYRQVSQIQYTLNKSEEILSFNNFIISIKAWSPVTACKVVKAGSLRYSFIAVSTIEGRESL